MHALCHHAFHQLKRRWAEKSIIPNEFRRMHKPRYKLSGDVAMEVRSDETTFVRVDITKNEFMRKGFRLNRERSVPLTMIRKMTKKRKGNALIWPGPLKTKVRRDKNNKSGPQTRARTKSNLRFIPTDKEEKKGKGRGRESDDGFD